MNQLSPRDIKDYNVVDIQARTQYCSFTFTLASTIKCMPDLTLIMRLHAFDNRMFTAVAFIDDPMCRMGIPFHTQEALEKQCKIILDDLHKRESL